MKRMEDCFLKVKNDYLKLLNKEKIFGKSAADKITSLKKTYIPMTFCQKFTDSFWHSCSIDGKSSCGKRPYWEF